MTERRYVKRFMKVWIIIAVIAIVIGYGIFRAKDFVRGPVVEVINPLTGSSFSEPFITIEGTAKNLSFLSLNGDKIFMDEAGVWKESVLLSPGYNVMQIRAEDRFGRTAIQELELTYTP